MRYYIIALLIHLSIFFVSDRLLTLGKPDITNKCTVPISYNVKDLPPRIDNIKKVKGSKAKAPAPKKEKQVKEETKKPEPKKIKKKTEKKQRKIKKEKKEFKSKIKELPSEIKKPEEIKEKKVPEKTEPKQTSVKEKTEKNQEIKKTIEKKDSKSKTPVKEAEDDAFAKNGNFTANADGTYTAFSAKGLDFKITHQVDPDYPRQAEVIRYGKTVIVEAKFLVDIKGKIEKIEIIKSHKKFGFDKEVIKALRKWKFKPIEYKGKKLKVYFNKKFIFKSKS